MSLTISAEPVPLETDADGVVRVGGTRVSLDSVIFAFNEGSTPEEIVQQYTTLSLADVYAVIGYYLHHQQEVDAYLLAREEQAQMLQHEIEARQPDRGNLRAKLLALQ